jgi:hypothetical protein
MQVNTRKRDYMTIPISTVSLFTPRYTYNESLPLALHCGVREPGNGLSIQTDITTSG